MLTLVTCRAFRSYSPQVAGNSYLPLVLLAESSTTSWTLEPGLSSHSQGRGWSQGARHRDIHRKDLQLFGSEEESTTCKQLEILQPDQYVRKCGSVPCALPHFLPVCIPCSFRPNRRVPGFSLIFKVLHAIGYHGRLLGFIPPGCVRPRRANAPSGMSAMVAHACRRWVRE